MPFLKKQRQIISRIIVGVVIFFLSFSLASLLMKKSQNSPFYKYLHFHAYNPPHPKWKLRKQNPPPPNNSHVTPSQKLYVMVIDEEYQPSKFQCLFVNQWVRNMEKSEVVDGIEIYSLNKWENTECNISSITINELPLQTINPSAFLLINSIKMALNRTDANWFFVIGDSAYIKVEKFLNYFQHIASENPPEDKFIIGNCVEERYFFQMLLLNSGILMSRSVMQQFVDTSDDHSWEIAFQTALTGEEILAEMADKNDIDIKTKHTNEFLGRGWRKPEHFDILRSKRFDVLPHCNIPYNYYVPGASELGLCSYDIVSLNHISVWSGVRGMSKFEFLDEAEDMLAGVPDYVSYYWDLLYPTLCIR